MKSSDLLNQMRKHAVNIFNAGFEIVKPETCIHGCCRLEDNIFFDKISDLFKTGHTHTNVMDIRVILVSHVNW